MPATVPRGQGNKQRATETKLKIYKAERVPRWCVRGSLGHHEPNRVFSFGRQGLRFFHIKIYPCIQGLLGTTSEPSITYRERLMSP